MDSNGTINSAVASKLLNTEIKTASRLLAKAEKIKILSSKGKTKNKVYMRWQVLNFSPASNQSNFLIGGHDALRKGEAVMRDQEKYPNNSFQLQLDTAVVTVRFSNEESDDVKGRISDILTESYKERRTNGLPETGV